MAIPPLDLAAFHTLEGDVSTLADVAAYLDQARGRNSEKFRRELLSEVRNGLAEDDCGWGPFEWERFKHHSDYELVAICTRIGFGRVSSCTRIVLIAWLGIV